MYWDPLKFSSIVFVYSVYYNWSADNLTGSISTAVSLANASAYCFITRFFSILYGQEQYYPLYIDCQKSPNSNHSIIYNFVSTVFQTRPWDLILLYVAIDNTVDVKDGIIQSSNWRTGSSVVGIDVNADSQIFILALIGFKCKKP